MNIEETMGNVIDENLEQTVRVCDYYLTINPKVVIGIGVAGLVAGVGYLGRHKIKAAFNKIKNKGVYIENGEDMNEEEFEEMIKDAVEVDMNDIECEKTSDIKEIVKEKK